MNLPYELEMPCGRILTAEKRARTGEKGCERVCLTFVPMCKGMSEWIPSLRVAICVAAYHLCAPLCANALFVLSRERNRDSANESMLYSPVSVNGCSTKDTIDEFSMMSY